MVDEELSGPERRLIDAAIGGALVDLSTGDAEQDDPTEGAHWPDARTLRAEIITELLTGVRKPADRQPRAVRVTGARVVGVLDLEAATLVCPLVLMNCHFEAQINLNDAQAAVIHMTGSHVPGIAADNLHVRGDLTLAGMTVANAEVGCIGARIGGQLNLSGASLTNPGGTALSGDGLTVDQDMFCRAGFTAEGEIRLIGAHIGGQLDFSGANLTNPDGNALTGDGLTVDQSMFCSDGFTAQGEIRLNGAHISAQLEFSGANLTNPDGIALNGASLTVDQGMFCSDGFTAQGEVRLNGAHISGQLGFSGANLTNPDGNALTGDNLTVDQGMFYQDGFTAQGEILLTGAHVGGQLNFNGANLTNPGGIALTGDRLTVDQDMFCNDGFTAQGEIRLSGAHISGQLGFSGANLTNPDGIALNGASLIVDQDMFCSDGFTAQGEIRLNGAHISAQLSFNGANLTNHDGAALSLLGVRADELWLLMQVPPEGVVDLAGTRVRSFHDDPATWPTAMWLREFVYEVLENDSVSVRARLGWLTRHQGGYAPGVYDQLGAAYRRAGHVEAARRVSIAKQRRRRRELHPLGKLWNWFLRVTVGYGYRPWLAGLWLAGLLAVGTFVFAGAHPALIHPASATAPQFQPVVYTLDVLLPIVDFGQEKAWVPQHSARIWTWALTGAGWVLTTAFIAGLTNALKRD